MANNDGIPILNAVNEVGRTISPYNLTSADNPRAVISHPLLKGHNYDEWANGMRTALMSRKKFGFLNRTITKPNDDSPDLEDWWTIQALLVSWIRMMIEPRLRSTISHRDVAKDLWDHLKSRFSVINGAKIQQIKQELACCKQKGMSIEIYYGKLVKIWDSLSASRPLRVCKCGHCTYDVGAQQEKDREEDKVHQFLFGLDDQFRSIRSNIVSKVPMQSLEEVYNLVRQEEDMRIIPEEKPETMAFAVQTRSRARVDERDTSVVYKHCNRTGHASDSCYAVIGYPEWWGDRPRSRVVTNQGRGGSSSGGRGRGQMVYANHVSVPHLDNQAVANHVVTDNDRKGINGLSDHQWKMIKDILNAKNTEERVSGKSYSRPWIMDSGCSHHMTGRLEMLTNIRTIDPVLVTLADGRQQVSRTEGTLHLSKGLILTSVYFVKELETDLLSLTQMMDETECVMQLAKEFVVVQDPSTRMVIGVGKRAGGTYHYCRMEEAQAVTTQENKTADLWHRRMGHPSARVVGLLPCVSSSVSTEIFNKDCDVCLRAKQTKKPISFGFE